VLHNRANIFRDVGKFSQFLKNERYLHFLSVFKQIQDSGATVAACPQGLGKTTITVGRTATAATSFYFAKSRYIPFGAAAPISNGLFIFVPDFHKSTLHSLFIMDEKVDGHRFCASF
jgi:hypothetical protein